MKYGIVLEWASRGVLLISSAFLLISRLVWPLTNIDFGSDQSRDMIVSNNILHGVFPLYGVPTSRGFDIFPQYYYVTAFFNLFSKDPIVNIMVNAVLNIGFVVLLYILVQKVFSFSRYKEFFGSICVFFFAFSYEAIWQANLMWNPNYLPFVMLVYLFIIFWLFDNQRTGDTRKFAIISALSGFLISFMMSLHSVAIFVLPFFSLFFGFWHIKSKRKQFFIYTTLGWFIPSLAYFIAEITHRFSNTKHALIFILKSAVNFVDFSLLDLLFFRVHNFFLSWLNIISTIYLPATYGTFVGIIGLVSLLGFFVYNKENKTYVQILSILVIVYLVVNSNLVGINYLHYMYMAYFLPLIGFFNFFLYLKPLMYKQILGIFALFVVVMGSAGNIKKVLVYSQQKYGAVYRTINTNDYYDIFAVAKRDGVSALCIPQKWDDRQEAAMNYYKDYVLHQSIEISKNCSENQSKKLYLVDQNNGYLIASKDFEESSIRLVTTNSAYRLYETK